MTIRNIADIAGCSDNTVRKIANQLYPDVRASKRGMAKKYEEYQCRDIMNRLPKRNNVGLNNEVKNGTPIEMALIQLVDQNTKMMAMMMQRMDLIEGNTKQPLQIEHVPEKTSRAIFKQHIDHLVELSNSDWSTMYNAVYSEMGYVYNVKIKARAKNRGIKPIDVLEQDNLMGKAIAVTRQMIERLDK